MKKYFILLTILFMTLNGCSGQNQTENLIDGFDLSKDDKQILFSYYKDKKSLIYTLNIDSRETKLLLESKKNYSYSNPKYSLDGKSFLFIEHNNNDVGKSTLCIAKSDGSEINRLTNGNGIITEAIFSNNKNEIVFCMANEYNKYSPIGIKNAHDFDIYSLNIEDKKVVKLTNLKAFGLNSISEINDNYILFRLESGQSSGMYIIDKNNSKGLKQFYPSNNPRNDKTLYYEPTYNAKYKQIIFMAPYELYKMDLNDKNAELIYSSNTGQLQKFCISNSSSFILFIKEFELDFYTINLNGKDLNRLPFKID